MHICKDQKKVKKTRRMFHPFWLFSVCFRSHRHLTEKKTYPICQFLSPVMGCHQGWSLSQNGKRQITSPWVGVPNWLDETWRYHLCKLIDLKFSKDFLGHHRIQQVGKLVSCWVSNISEKNRIGQDQDLGKRQWGRLRRQVGTPLVKLGYHYQNQPPQLNKQLRIEKRF